jgi:hypothetical protein
VRLPSSKAGTRKVHDKRNPKISMSIALFLFFTKKIDTINIVSETSDNTLWTVSVAYITRLPKKKNKADF